MKKNKEYEELINTINDYEKIFEDKKPRINKIKIIKIIQTKKNFFLLTEIKI